ncbi:MAG: signal peptidase I [Eggerthellaceae bacterium]|nr:signal peptidase I [Eggerthellaceae bacterium]
MNTLRRIGQIVSTLLVALMVVLAVALVGVRLVGFEVFAVLSGSMEPTYHVGSLIWVDEREPEEVKVGDPITFVLNEDLDVATHRVIEIDAENQHFYTQGDANDAPDGSPVHFENLIGVPVFTVPYLGYLVSCIQQPPGLYIAFIIAVAALVLMLISDKFKTDPEEEWRRTQERAAKNAKQYPCSQPPRHSRAALEAMDPAQRAYLAQRELERRRAERGQIDNPRSRAQTRPATSEFRIPKGSNREAASMREERR